MSVPLGASGAHESARGHVTGEAQYVDDFPLPSGSLVAWVVPSPHAHAKILSRSGAEARAMPGIVAVLFADDIPGSNMIGPIVHDEPLLAEARVHAHGQAVALVVGETLDACRLAAARVEVIYEPLEAILDISSAIEAKSFSTDPHRIRRGDIDAAFKAAALTIRGEIESGAQDHFYLETQVALALPQEKGAIKILSSTQHPTEIQKMVASVLAIGNHQVVCEVPRLGGGFGGKESQATQPACLAALGTQVSGRAVKLWLDRDRDMRETGKRHPFWSRYEAAFDELGTLLGLRVEIYSDGGWSADLSGPVLDRALFHLDNAYYVPAVDFVGRVCRTHLPSNTAFRGFGGPQGMLVIEEAINRAAERLGVDPAEIRSRNFYGQAPRDRAPYGQSITHNRLPRIWEELSQSSDYFERRAEIEVWNADSAHFKRGLGFQPVKFGISFTKSLLNQAGALVLVYADGTVQLNHGGTEMGQGLHTKMIAICAHELGVDSAQVRQMMTSTEKVPNTSPTAASSGSDLNGQAVATACAKLRARMSPVAALMLGRPRDCEMLFEGSMVGPCDAPNSRVSFKALAQEAWLQRVSLSATGFYATPGIDYDAALGQGTPFFYFAFGGAVTEVELNVLTGEWRIRRIDILHDAGRSLVPNIDRGQVEGAFVQGAGWLSCEEVIFDDRGRLLTHGPSTYKIPAVGDVPLDFRVRLLERAPAQGVIHGSKAVGEPPLMLAISLVTALRHAIAAFVPSPEPVELRLPCTPESVLRALEHRKKCVGALYPEVT